MATHLAWHFMLGLALGGLLTRLGMPLARRWGQVDRPDRERKLHQEAVPTAGGVAVFVAAATVLVVSCGISPLTAGIIGQYPRQSLGLLLAAAAMVVLGVLDDRYGLRARYKLLGQLAAVVPLTLWGGFEIACIGLFGWTVELGPLAVPVTILWLLACINALNLIDGMDGLLGMIGGIALLSLAALAFVTGQSWAVLVALTLAGAVLGFLWWNLPPARVYMGDAGSMLVGLVVGALAIVASLKGPATVALGAPLAILILPVFDTVAAILRRKLTSRSLATPDRGHLHHVLLRRGLTAPRILTLLAGLAVLAAAGALASIALQNDLFALISAAGVVVMLVAGKLFGHAEWILLQKRLSSAARSLWPPGDHLPPAAWAVHLQGQADWNRLWTELIAWGQRLHLCSLELDVNAPFLHENYHACWQGPKPPQPAMLWRLEIPLVLEGRPIGRLSVAAACDERPLAETMQSLLQVIALTEDRVVEIANGQRRPPNPAGTRAAPGIEDAAAIAAAQA